MCARLICEEGKRQQRSRWCWSGIWVQWLCNFRFVSTRYENKRRMSGFVFHALGGCFHVGAPRWGSKCSSESVSFADQTHFMPPAFQRGPEKQIKTEPVTWRESDIVCWCEIRGCLPNLIYTSNCSWDWIWLLSNRDGWMIHNHTIYILRSVMASVKCKLMHVHRQLSSLLVTTAVVTVSCDPLVVLRRGTSRYYRSESKVTVRIVWILKSHSFLGTEIGMHIMGFFFF